MDVSQCDIDISRWDYSLHVCFKYFLKSYNVWPFKMVSGIKQLYLKHHFLQQKKWTLFQVAMAQLSETAVNIPDVFCICTYVISVRW